jgi:hypothetical protein
VVHVARPQVCTVVPGDGLRAELLRRLAALTLAAVVTGTDPVIPKYP